MGQNYQGKIIEAGYPWRVRLEFTSSMTFPEGTTFVCQVRETVDAPDVIIELTTENEGIVRINNTALELRIDETDPSIWPVGKTVVMDIVRTDLTQNEHLGIRLQVPVRNPVTRL